MPPIFHESKIMKQTLRQKLLKIPLIETPDLTGKYYLVTGCAIGSLGFATAKALLEKGANVTVTRRSNTQACVDALITNVAGCEGRIYQHELDLANAESVKQFIAWYKNEVGQLDALVNNAGIHLDLMSKWTEPKLSDDGYEIQWRLNYLGTVQLTHGLLPLLLESANTAEARVVNVVSMLHSKGDNRSFFENHRPYNSWHAYGQSKLGLVHFTQSLRDKYGEHGLLAYSLHPGAVYTNVAAKGLKGHKFLLALRSAFSFVEKFFLLTPNEGAQTVLHCATSNLDDLGNGLYFNACKSETPSLEVSDNAEQKAVQEKLWRQSLEWVSSL